MIRKIPKHITLILNETETIFLLDLPSSIVPKDTEEGEAAEADNQLYAYITKGKGRNRKMNSIGVQTLPILLKTRHTEPVQYKVSDNSTFVSNWEMYDTYQERQRIEDLKYYVKEDKDVLLPEEEDFFISDGHQLNEEITIEMSRKPKEVKELEKLETNRNYFDAALVIERLLANNYYYDAQKKFKGISETADSSENVRYDYKLELLWSFSNADTKNRCVTGISFNKCTEDILAVGYGKYYFKDRKNTGVVMLWNIKNPKQPEREYYFDYSVTSLEFATKNPNYLVVGFYNGDIKVIDVSKRDLTLIGEDGSVSFEPAWDVTWFAQDGAEDFLVCFGDGRICKYHITATGLKSVQIMRTDKVEGRLKGLNALRLFEGNEISSSRYASAIRLGSHPFDSFKYMVATNEGVIHRCTTNYCTQHLDMFKAHEGPIHAIKYSPFVNKVFATCGDDFQKCLWVEGIDEPIITSRHCLEPVLDIEWSPSHSTILASLRGMDIFLWDFQRKVYSPQSRTESPTNSRNTICKFTPGGRSLLVGDVDGNVHIFSISGLPFPAFFQENLFFQSIKNILLTNTQLIRKLEKLGSLNYE